MFLVHVCRLWNVPSGVDINDDNGNNENTWSTITKTQYVWRSFCSLLHVVVFLSNDTSCFSTEPVAKRQFIQNHEDNMPTFLAIIRVSSTSLGFIGFIVINYCVGTKNRHHFWDQIKQMNNTIFFHQDTLYLQFIINKSIFFMSSSLLDYKLYLIM